MICLMNKFLSKTSEMSKKKIDFAGFWHKNRKAAEAAFFHLSCESSSASRAFFSFNDPSKISNLTNLHSKGPFQTGILAVGFRPTCFRATASSVMSQHWKPWKLCFKVRPISSYKVSISSSSKRSP